MTDRRVSVVNAARIKVAEIQSFYKLKDTNKALLKAVNLAYEELPKKE